ncbi:MAG: SMC-Scp complex subunit ScpB, partial [Janthinobacterium lividum]
GLIRPAGRREAPGRPTLWATTPAFLAQFGLRDLRDLPRREDLVVEPPGLAMEEPSAAAAFIETTADAALDGQ